MISHYFTKDVSDSNKISRSIFFAASIIYLAMIVAFTVGWFIKLNVEDLTELLISITTTYVTITSWYIKSVKDKEIEEIRKRV
jgi:hypothetical protein|tara:strand:- start:526 stop:774 length:249 start_codon:yes stop_codon:yes gene_type:complete